MLSSNRYSIPFDSFYPRSCKHIVTSDMSLDPLGRMYPAYWTEQLQAMPQAETGKGPKAPSNTSFQTLPTEAATRAGGTTVPRQETDSRPAFEWSWSGVEVELEEVLVR